MNEKIEVRCKYFDGEIFKGNQVGNLWCTAPDNIDCADLFGQVNCSTTFKIDWIKFILLKDHIIEDRI